MKIAKDGIRSIVKVGYDGRVYKTFRGTDKEGRFDNECRVLNVLEARGCDYVPRLLDSDPETLTIVTTNCGTVAEGSISDERAAELFKELEEEFGVVHDDPFPRNITYHPRMGRFCIIDFELAEVKEDPQAHTDEEEAHRVVIWSGLTRAGRRKGENQDALSVFSSEEGWAYDAELVGKQSIDENGLVFAVSDGMGGPAAGEVASTLVVRELRRFLPAMMGDFQGAVDPEGVLDASVKSLHDYVTRTGEASDELRGMGATVVCGLFFRTKVYFAHVGDSRFYRFREGKLEQLTQDHTFLGGQFRAGRISEREMRTHPRRNVLKQAIGGGCQFVNPQVDSSSLEPGDWFLICSDGIVDGLWNRNIAQSFEEAEASQSNPEVVAEQMLERACKEAGMDDTTLFVIRIEKGS
ncbi:MAG: protein phosphatase 2C domain-containing protein [Verrucomicrobiota bacterium]